jgi:hypothetical protein
VFWFWAIEREAVRRNKEWSNAERMGNGIFTAQWLPPVKTGSRLAYIQQTPTEQVGAVEIYMGKGKLEVLA